MEKNKKIWIGAGCSIAILGIAATTGVLIWKNGQTSEVTYRETTVEYGNLTVGITEDSTVNIGTVSQTFDLDISALVSSVLPLHPVQVRMIPWVEWACRCFLLVEIPIHHNLRRW